MKRLLLLLLLISGLAKAQDFDFDCTPVQYELRASVSEFPGSRSILIGVYGDGVILTNAELDALDAGNNYALITQINDTNHAQATQRNRGDESRYHWTVGASDLLNQLYAAGGSEFRYTIPGDVLRTSIAVDATVYSLRIWQDEDHVRVAVEGDGTVLTDAEFTELAGEFTDMALRIGSVSYIIPKSDPYPGRHWIISDSTRIGFINRLGATASFSVNGVIIMATLEAPPAYELRIFRSFTPAVGNVPAINGFGVDVHRANGTKLTISELNALITPRGLEHRAQAGGNLIARYSVDNNSFNTDHFSIEVQSTIDDLVANGGYLEILLDGLTIDKTIAPGELN